MAQMQNTLPTMPMIKFFTAPDSLDMLGGIFGLIQHNKQPGDEKGCGTQRVRKIVCLVGEQQCKHEHLGQDGHEQQRKSGGVFFIYLTEYHWQQVQHCH